MRIIAGKWRSRRLTVPDQTGVRPTGDRIRETLFNWLGPRIIGASVLDLFAGAGALGFEAASRGAGKVVMIDRSHQVIAHLDRSRAMLDAQQVEVVHADAINWLSAEPTDGFDIVLIDPPFDSDLMTPALQALFMGVWFRPGARIYLETLRTSPRPILPAGWQLLREKTAGDVWFALAAQSAD